MHFLWSNTYFHTRNTLSQDQESNWQDMVFATALYMHFSVSWIRLVENKFGYYTDQIFSPHFSSICQLVFFVFSDHFQQRFHSLQMRLQLLVHFLLLAFVPVQRNVCQRGQTDGCTLISFACVRHDVGCNLPFLFGRENCRIIYGKPSFHCQPTTQPYIQGDSY